MEIRVTYDVFAKHKTAPEEWRPWAVYVDSYEDAKTAAYNALKNHRFSEVKIVKRLETLEDIETWGTDE